MGRSFSLLCCLVCPKLLSSLLMLTNAAFITWHPHNQLLCRIANLKNTQTNTFVVFKDQLYLTRDHSLFEINLKLQNCCFCKLLFIPGGFLASLALPNMAAEGFSSGGGGRLAFTGVIDDWTAQSGRPVLVSNFVPAVSDSGAKFA